MSTPQTFPISGRVRCLQLKPCADRGLVGPLDPTRPDPARDPARDDVALNTSRTFILRDPFNYFSLTPTLPLAGRRS